ncbi:MAG: hypothetical protein DHS20C08_15650 [Rhodomicrobium sp.]|nr:MAG: hypothetical protein DHS20C08_15650 [Rhodomicrobium sp.]
MDLGTIPDWLQLLAVCITSYVAIRGIRAWETETVGKRKIELAENALTAFYEFRDVMIAIRCPDGYEDESKKRVRHPDETDEQARSLDAYFRSLQRYTDSQELFSSFSIMEYRFYSYFGKAGRKPFEKQRFAKNRVLSAARQLLSTSTPFSVNHLCESNRNKLENLLWDNTGGESDEINDLIDEAISEIEKLCEPILLRSKT